MSKLIIPKKYKSDPDLYRTQMLIKDIKDFFQVSLSNSLNLRRVSAPLFVPQNSGLNDELSGVEKAVSFDLPNAGGAEMEIVHSLAKWKRFALKEYKFKTYEGLYTDMDAIRRCEEPDNLHSFYVDQWDWEKIIKPSDRNLGYLKYTVNSIYQSFLQLDEHISFITKRERLLPSKIEFIDSDDLLKEYPSLSPDQREYEAVKKYRAVFLMGIGKKLSNGSIHDTRAADYDDWNLNGDILVYNPILDGVMELSSMGIRVDKDALLSQLEAKGEMKKVDYAYHKNLIEGKLPQTIGGGIGQSRLCMFFLQKAHIGEVQVSYRPDDMREELGKKDIFLL